jgi:hypothetical protein
LADSRVWPWGVWDRRIDVKPWDLSALGEASDRDPRRARCYGQRPRTGILAALLALSRLSLQEAAADELTLSERAALQATMFGYIDREAIKGSFLHVDISRGTVEPISPVKAHPMIVRTGDYFVLCTNFRREDGKDVNVDFYPAKRDAGFEVFHTEIDNHGPLEQLINRGKAPLAE